MKLLNTGEATVEDDIRPEMLKALQLILKKLMITNLETSFRRCCYSMALMASYQLVSSRCTSVHAFRGLCSC